MCKWLFCTSPYAKSFCSDNHSGHSVIYGTVVMKITHWSNSGFRTLMSSNLLIATGHGGRDRMTKETQRKYVNDSTNDLELFTSRCQECQKKRKRPMTKGMVVRPTEQRGCTKRTGWSRCYVVHAKEQLQMDRGKMYQGHLTKFCVLWSIKSKRPAEVAAQFMGIFPFLVLRQYFRVTMVLSVKPTSSRKLKTSVLFGLQFMAKPVICRVRDLFNDQMVTWNAFRWPGLLITTRMIGLQASSVCSSRRNLPIIQEWSAVQTQLCLAKKFVWDSSFLPHTGSVQ